MAVEAAAPTRRLWSREEFRRMVEVGIIKETDRVELIRGEIIEMTKPGRRHIAFVNNLNALLVVRLRGRAIVSVQNPVVVADDSEPQPDLAVCRLRELPYKEREPYAEDTLLLIEVSDTSLAYDRSTKLRLYVETGIPEYWIVNCADESIDVHRSPSPTGYLDVTRVSGAGTVGLQAFPDVVLALPDIFA
ncbi:MAG TPA: Uma2 family endonuclease [Candidatus Tectomicrobia bacterium]|nr:Uma2 family endonuclease [Candidatus Tectomicrobia bacterium]